MFFLFPLVDFHLLNLAFVLCLNMSVLLRPECAGLFGAALIVFVLNFWTGLMAVLRGGDQRESEIRDRRAVWFSVTFLSRREEMEHFAGDEEDD